MDQPNLPGTDQPAPPYRLAFVVTPMRGGGWSVATEHQDIWTDEVQYSSGRLGLTKQEVTHHVALALYGCQRVAEAYEPTDALRRALDRR